MYVQVSNHIIAAPSANQLDDVDVGAGTEDRHGPCGAEWKSGDILGFESQVWAAEHDGGLDGLVYHGWCYVLPSSCRNYDAG